MNILLLEDDPIRVVAFHERLKATGRDYVLTHYERAADAVVALKANKYDLVLLDHDLGGRTFVDHGDPKEDCGMRVAEFFMVNPNEVRKHGPIVVHSLNGPAAQQMVEYIGEAMWCPFVWQREIWPKYINIPRVSDRQGREAGPKDGTPKERDGEAGTPNPNK